MSQTFRIYFIALFFLSVQSIFAQIKSPDEFLPHNIGEEFTPHHLLVDYYEYVAANSDQVILRPYGRTNEGRPLMVAFVSTPENLKKLEEIRLDNMKRVGTESGTPNNQIPITWISYSVHGNEAAGSESSMPVLYELVGGKNKAAQDWLKNTIVVLDPCINPDGYSRYTHWVKRAGNKMMHTDPDSWEHQEPWPGGRMNHYFFDLNRDWAWQTQIESQQRMKLYNEWMPQIHADVHEMHHNDPYYFAPAAQPYHQYITKWQGDFQTEIGKNHASYFDKNGWLYYTKEIFDLFYPSYGDTYPTFNGAIGMTYEQGGSGSAGRGIDKNNGEQITLHDRVAHHTATSLSTVEMGSKNAKRLLDNFENYFKSHAKNPIGQYKSFVIKNTNDKEKVKALLNLLDKNKIQYGTTKATSSLRGFDYTTGKTTSYKLKSDDIVISAYQARSVLTQVLFEPEAFLVDSLTYDITAWSLPYAYGLEAFAVKEKISVDDKYFTTEEFYNLPNNAYGYLVKWNSLKDARFLAAVMDKGFTVRAATQNFTIEGQDFKMGTLLIMRGENRRIGSAFDKMIKEIATQLNHPVIPVSTGFAEKGPDLGSESLLLLKKPNIAVLTGENTSPYSFGQIWHYFETDLEYPITTIPVANLGRTDLNKYSLLIMPEGWYSVNDATMDKIKNWVRSGGRVIAIGSALSKFDGKDGFALEKFAESGDESAARRDREETTLAERLDPYAHRSRKSISNYIAGAIFKVNMDNTHPLAFGFPNYYFSLKTGSRNYQPLKGAINVGHIGKNPQVMGFAGAKAKEAQSETVVFAVQEMGRGNITYMVDNPLYRAFWYQGKFLFSNAVFLNQ